MIRTYRAIWVLFALLFLNAVVFGQPAGNQQFQVEFNAYENRSFIENKGQFDERDEREETEILYAVDWGEQQIFFTSQGVSYRFENKIKNPNREQYDRSKPKQIKQSKLIHMRWEGANSNVQVVAEEEANDYHTYTRLGEGKRIEQFKRVSGFKKIRYNNLYPNIDVVYEFHPEGGIKYSLIVHPGGDVSDFKMAFEENQKTRLENGMILIDAGKYGEIKEHTPFTFYENNEGNTVDSKFIATENGYSFELGNYNENQTIVVDPWVETPDLSTSNCVWEVERDGAGNVYIIGGDTPMRLQKYDPNGNLQWTYNTPWTIGDPNDPDEGDWLGALATDDTGNSYVTRGSTAGIQQVNTNGDMVWNNAGNTTLLDEYWNIAFNCDQTKLIIGGTTGTLEPEASIFDVDVNNGDILDYQVVSTNFDFLGGGEEVRSITSSFGGKYYFLTHLNIGAINDDFSVCGDNEPLFLEDHGYDFGYKHENYRPNNGNAGSMSIRADDQFFYTHNGETLHKRDLMNGAVLATANLPGGIYNTDGFTGKSQAGASGIAIDDCGNVYAGSGDRVIKFDSDLNELQTEMLPFRVYDVKIHDGGNILVCGATGDNGQTVRTGYLQQINMNACEPFPLICCDATVCPQDELCHDDAPVTLVPSQDGGTWSGTGIVDTNNGVFDPAEAGPGDHMVYHTLDCGVDSILITVIECLDLDACLEPNGDITASEGVEPYTWYVWNEGGTQPINNQQECEDCGYTWQGFTSSCMDGMFPVDECDVDPYWEEYTTGTTITPPADFPIRVVDDNGNELVINSINDLEDCQDCPELVVTIDEVVDATCNEENGSITVSVSGGQDPYTFDWIGPDGYTGTGETISDLAEGQYELTVTDDNGCDTLLTVDVGAEDSPVINGVDVVQETCDGQADGSATVFVDGDINDYEVSWNTDPVQTGETATDLVAGDYTVTVTDTVNGCFATLDFTIDPSDPCECPLEVDINSVNPDCEEANGSIEVVVTAGSGDYEFNWDDGHDQAQYNDLEAGSYTIEVVDVDEACSLEFTINLSGGNLTINEIDITHEGCEIGACDGSIVVDADGAEQYSIDGGTTWQATGDFLDLCPGDYNLAVEDDTGCIFEETITIEEGSNLEITNVSTASAGCDGNCDGFISLSVSGGTPPYTYVWEDGIAGQNESQALDVCEGEYEITVLDNGDCSVTQTVIIEADEDIAIDNIVVTDISCFGECDGQLEIISANGDQYSIDGGDNFVGTNIFSNLCPGEYEVVVANDDLSCSTSQTVTLTEPVELGVTTEDYAACPGDDVTISATPSGGLPPYSYNWDNGLGAGASHTVSPDNTTVYTVTVTDANGCVVTGESEVSVNEPLNILLVGPSEPVCPGADVPMSVFVLSESSGATYSWTSDDGSGWTSNESNPVVTPTENPTTYTVEVTNDCGETLTESVVVNLYDVPEVTFEAESEGGCEVVEVMFVNTTNQTTSSDCHWTFGDGNAAFGCDSVLHVYESPGCYDVTLTVFTDEGCAVSNTITDAVCVEEGPTANFDYNPKEIDHENPITYFINQSTNANSYVWTFDIFGSSELINPQFTFPQDSTAMYEVCLEAISDLGCRDTICKNVLVSAELFVYVPNAFTPDGDGFNDEFLVVGNDLVSYNFEFLIFNRWGNLIFESDDPFRGWDGRHNGRLVQEGVYVWKLKLRQKSGSETHEFIGHVTLLR